MPLISGNPPLIFDTAVNKSWSGFESRKEPIDSAARKGSESRTFPEFPLRTAGSTPRENITVMPIASISIRGISGNTRDCVSARLNSRVLLTKLSIK